MTGQEPGAAAAKDEAASSLVGLAALLREAGFSFADSAVAAIEADRQSARQRIDSMCAAFDRDERLQP